MIEFAIAWLALPFVVGFAIYLLPKLDRILALGMVLVSAVYAGEIFLQASAWNIQLLDNFGVSLSIDRLSGFFIITNVLVTAAVIIYCWQTGKTAFFYTQLIILHGSVNAAFVCADLISLYVSLEVISIAAFLLITYLKSDRSIWVGLRYLFISNVVMLFYLVGAVLVYQAHHSFNYAGLRGSPPEAVALIFLGLLAKGGIFVSGFWLPLTHSESASPVSAMLSGVVVKAGVFPLVRCALMLPEFDPIVRIFGVGTALLGVVWAIVERDTKRTLAFSTVSQLGFILAAPPVGGFYALTHGLVKSALFLIAGTLPSRDFQQLRQQSLPTKLWLPLAIASFSISGFPLLSGFGAKILTSKNLLPWQAVAINLATLGTTIVFAKFIFLPHGKELDKGLDKESKIQPGFWWAMVILLGSLIGANVVYYQAYTLTNIIKPLITIALGWLIYLSIIRRLNFKLPRQVEQFEHLIGGMSLMLIAIFWMVRIQSVVSQASYLPR